jgi:hypothetical protein
MREQVAQLMRERDAAVDRAAQEHFDAVLGRALTVPDIAEQVRECSWSDRAREQLCISRQTPPELNTFCGRMLTVTVMQLRINP